MTKLRCRPGDLARVMYSIYPVLIGRTVFVKEWNDERGRWNVVLLGSPSFGLTYSNLPVFSNELAFRDASLKPLRGEEFEVIEGLAEEVPHAN